MPEENGAADSTSGGLFGKLRRLLASGVGIVQTRLELLAVEVEEEKLRFISLLIIALAALFCGIFCVAALVALLVVVFWQNNVLVLAIFVAIFGAAGIFLGNKARCIANQPPRLFRSSLAELNRDRNSLQDDDMHEGIRK